MVFLKFLLILISLLLGAMFLAEGLGADIPALEYNGLKANAVPIGIVFLAFGVAIAALWKISVKKTQTVTIDTADGKITHSSETITNYRMRPDKDGRLL